VLKSRTHIWLAVAFAGVGLFIAALLGLFAYMSLTATPLHPNPQEVRSVTHSAPSAKWAGAVEKARQAVRAGVTDQNLPGISVAVGVGDEIVWAEGFGWADLESHAPVSPELRFRTANTSIVLTSAAAGLLLESDKLKLDEAIQTYVPEFPKKQWPVTLRQLMAHTAGIRGDEGDEEPLSVRCDRTVDGLERFAQNSLLFEPGTQYRFASYGWILVSAAIETAAGQPFFTFMQKRIFEPLGMEDTIVDSATEPIPDRATFYFPRFAGDNRYGPELAREGDHSCFAGAGAFLSTPSDLARFLIAINRGTLLKPATVETLQTPQRLTSGQQIDYGLGWSLETVSLAGQPTRMAGHGTKVDFIGGTTSVITFPERGLVVAVMTNISFADTKSLALGVAQAFGD
jgi:CubicO group peptidase (beta-lactamase class C family)